MKLITTVKTERENRAADDKTIRNWAWRNGFQPFDFGKISDEVHQAFVAAHAEYIQAATQAAHEEFLAEFEVWSLSPVQL